MFLLRIRSSLTESMVPFVDMDAEDSEPVRYYQQHDIPIHTSRYQPPLDQIVPIVSFLGCTGVRVKKLTNASALMRFLDIAWMRNEGDVQVRSSLHILINQPADMFSETFEKLSWKWQPQVQAMRAAESLKLLGDRIREDDARVKFRAVLKRFLVVDKKKNRDKDGISDKAHTTASVAELCSRVDLSLVLLVLVLLGVYVGVGFGSRFSTS